MDFNDTPEEAAFRAEVRAWLEANAPKRKSEGIALDEAKAWQARKAMAGYAQLASPIQRVIYGEEEAKFVERLSYFSIGLGMCIPTLAAWGTEEMRARYVEPALRGEEIWCQLFSEPGAGSDLAGLKTRAVRDGADWIVNGQKVWTSGAHYSDFGLLITRTDPTLPKHKGLTMFFLSMKSPGVEVRPIKQISGGSNFNEVFFTDVRIPDSQRLGPIGEGWKVSLTTLMHERLAVGDAPGPGFEEIFELARGLGVLSDSAVREKLADFYIRGQGLKYTKARTMTALSRGQVPGPEASIAKLVSASKLQEISSFGMELLDEAGIVRDHELAARFQEGYLLAPAFRIAGGTDEILRNIIAERVLGLPSDIRVDKDVPFNQIISGTKSA